jgi:hypothetical protein
MNNSTGYIRQQILRTNRNLAITTAILALPIIGVAILDRSLLDHWFLVFMIATVCFNIYKLISRRDHTRHPIWQGLKVFGIPDLVEKGIQEDRFQRLVVLNKSTSISGRWIFHQYGLGLHLIKISNIVWVYKKVTTHKTNFVETHKTHSIIIETFNGSFSFENSEFVSAHLVDQIHKSAPWVFFGFTEELRKGFAKTPAVFKGMVEERKRAFPNHLSSVAYAPPIAPTGEFQLSALKQFAICSLIAVLWWVRYMPSNQGRIIQTPPSSEVTAHIAYPPVTLEAPSPMARRMADTAGFTDEARQLFYSTNPTFISDKNNLHEACRDAEDHSILGCHIDGKQKIFLYVLPYAQLNELAANVSAHELLHAAYYQLTKQEQINLFLLIDSKLKEEPSLLAKFKERYGQRLDASELHSLVGTEVLNLPPALEAHYQQYFTNRNALVLMASKAENTVATKEAESMRTMAKINSIKSQIEAKTQTISDLSQSIESMKVRLELARKLENFDEFNEMVPMYNSRIEDKRSEVASANELINHYNSLIRKLTKNAAATRSIIRSIDTRVGKSISQQKDQASSGT